MVFVVPSFHPNIRSAATLNPQFPSQPPPATTPQSTATHLLRPPGLLHLRPQHISGALHQAPALLRSCLEGRWRRPPPRVLPPAVDVAARLVARRRVHHPPPGLLPPRALPPGSSPACKSAATTFVASKNGTTIIAASKNIYWCRRSVVQRKHKGVVGYLV